MITVLGKCMKLMAWRSIEVIKTFADKHLKALWNTGKSRIDARLHVRILRRLEYLNGARRLERSRLELPWASWVQSKTLHGPCKWSMVHHIRIP